MDSSSNLSACLSKFNLVLRLNNSKCCERACYLCVDVFTALTVLYRLYTCMLTDVSLETFLGFNKIMQLTDDINVIAESIHKKSALLQVRAS